MDEAFRLMLQAKLADFRGWSAVRSVTGYRLVQYCGVDLIGALSGPLSEIEAQIEGLVCEGMTVDWAEKGGLVYLRVWEFGGPEPDWSKVFTEVPIADLKPEFGPCDG
jgi:hypothetical protein